MTRGTNEVPSARPSGTTDGITELLRASRLHGLLPGFCIISRKVYLIFQRCKIRCGGTVPICPLLMLPEVDAKHVLSSGAVDEGGGSQPRWEEV